MSIQYKLQLLVVLVVIVVVVALITLMSRVHITDTPDCKKTWVIVEVGQYDIIVLRALSIWVEWPSNKRAELPCNLMNESMQGWISPITNGTEWSGRLDINIELRRTGTEMVPWICKWSVECHARGHKRPSGTIRRHPPHSPPDLAPSDDRRFLVTTPSRPRHKSNFESRMSPFAYTSWKISSYAVTSVWRSLVSYVEKHRTGVQTYLCALLDQLPPFT